MSLYAHQIVCVEEIDSVGNVRAKFYFEDKTEIMTGWLVIHYCFIQIGHISYIMKYIGVLDSH